MAQVGGRDRRGVIRRRVQESRRVREVMAAAIVRATDRAEGLQIEWNEALQLAESGSIRDVLHRLRERRQIRRAIPGLPADRTFQNRLAVAEVVADVTSVHGKDSGARLRFIEQALEDHAERHRQAETLDEVTRAIEITMKELEASQPLLREFLRRASRLRSEQHARIREHISDDKALRGSLARLDTVYTRWLELAMTFTIPGAKR